MVLFLPLNSYSLTDLFKNNDLKEDEAGVDFCISSSDGMLLGANSRDLHIDYRTSNPSAIDLVSESSKDNKCLKK